MEEHNLYLFAIKCIASVSLKARSNLSVKDREKSLTMSLVAERDLRDEFFTLKSFCYPDSLFTYITSVVEHCKAIVNLRVPMEAGTIFPMAPTWVETPIDDDWDKVMYQER